MLQDRLTQLEKENRRLRREVERLEANQARQERLFDTNRTLLRRVNEEHAALLRELAEKTEQLENILRHAPVAIAIKDLQGRYVVTNAGFAELLGREQAELVGGLAREFLSPEEAVRVEAHDRAVQERGEVVSEQFVRNADGEPRIYHGIKFPIFDEAGSVRQIGLVVSDVTELKTLEQEAIHASQLASIGCLAAGVAHEINNPLNGVINYAERIESGAEDPDQVRALAGKLVSEAVRISGIVRSLLSYSRPRPGAVEEAEPVDLPAVINEALYLCAPQLTAAGVEVGFMPGTGLPAVRGRAQELLQVFINLTTNSLAALDSTDRRERRIDVRLARSNGRLRIDFADTGCGIAPDALGRVFAPFFTTRSDRGGTGLGLSICKRIVESCGGEIAVESRPGEGARFTVLLPVAAEGCRC
jgi:PAS domain S-box-containing protein